MDEVLRVWDKFKSMRKMGARSLCCAFYKPAPKLDARAEAARSSARSMATPAGAASKLDPPALGVLISWGVASLLLLAKEPTMKQIIVMYNLKSDVTPDAFEAWVRSVDQPNMRGLNRVSHFRTFRTEGLLMGEGKPSVGYVEVFDITDLDGFTGEDMPGDIVQMVMSAFMGLVENPEFVIASEV